MSVPIDPNLKKIIKNVSLELSLSEVLVTSIYYQYLKTLRTELEKLPLKEKGTLLSEEEFGKLTTSFNIKYIGKIHTNYLIYKTKNTIVYGQHKI